MPAAVSALARPVTIGSETRLGDTLLCCAGKRDSAFPKHADPAVMVGMQIQNSERFSSRAAGHRTMQNTRSHHLGLACRIGVKNY
jgi:hypothetical protein